MPRDRARAGIASREEQVDRVGIDVARAIGRKQRFDLEAKYSPRAS
jgi:hypothetical protein